MTVDSVWPKRRKFSFSSRTYSMDPEAAKAKLTEMKEKFGRHIRVFETVAATPAPIPTQETDEMDEDFYNFTREDWERIKPKKKDTVLKTKKFRDAEEAARRARVTTAVIRVRFPDSTTLEATFHPSEKITLLVDLLGKVIARPDLPFYLYTTPPKRIIKDMSVDFYSAGFIPGAIVYFSYNNVPKDEDVAAAERPFLSEEVMALKGLDLESIAENARPAESAPQPQETAPASLPVVQERQPPADKKTIKPKWLKM